MEGIKGKLKSVISLFKTRELSEQTALITTILGFFLILVILILTISFVLPKTKVEISISGPETAKVGEEIIYKVTIKNAGDVVLKNPELIFNYPSFSLPEGDLIETIILKDSLYPNQEKVFEFKAQLFGDENEKREAKTWLNYSTGDKSSTMSEIARWTTYISEVPIDLILDIPKKIPVVHKTESESVFRVRYLSLIDHAIPDLKLSISFPEDFIFKESIPLRGEEQYWKIPKLESLSRGEVEIMGFFPAGQEIGKELEFIAKLSINLQGTDVILKEFRSLTTTFEPNFTFTQLINNQEKYSPYSGERLHYEIYFKNIQEKPLSNLTITTVLEGNLYNLDTIEAHTGTFYEGGRSIFWDGEKIPQLRYLMPGEEGKIEFWVQLKEDYKPKDLTETNSSIRNRVILGDFEKEFINRVSSRIKISQEGFFKDVYGFFENQGPHPPRINETTHYTIVWKLENYYNWIENVEIKATLPRGIFFRSVKSTQGEIKITTDPYEIKSPYYPVIPTGFKFENPLYENLRNEEVRYLQIILKREVPHAFPEYVPASGYFGPITVNAVKAFQEKYRKEILAPQGLGVPTGHIDRQTQLKLNELLLAGVPLGFTEAIWEINNVTPGVGIFEDSWIAAFQIAFTPELVHMGKNAILVNEVTISARDLWTGMVLFSTDQSIDTTIDRGGAVR